MEDLIETREGQIQDYFSNFMATVIRDLKKRKESFVFNKEQLDYILNIYKDLDIVIDEGFGFAIKLKGGKCK